MSEQTVNEHTVTARRGARPSPSTRMGTLASEYPELATFTADATLLEIKVKHGLGTLEEVRALGRRRAAAGEHQQIPSASGGCVRTVRASRARGA